MRPPTTTRRTALCIAAITLAGCGGETSPATDDTTATRTSSTTIDAPAVSRPPDGSVGELIEPADLAVDGVTTGEAPATIVDDLIERVSEEAGVDPSDVVVVGSFAKTWTGGSLGCAEPGIVHSKREQAGYQVELTAGGESWDFRVRESGELIACSEGVVVRSEANE